MSGIRDADGSSLRGLHSSELAEYDEPLREWTKLPTLFCTFQKIDNGAVAAVDEFSEAIGPSGKSKRKVWRKWDLIYTGHDLKKLTEAM